MDSNFPELNFGIFDVTCEVVLTFRSIRPNPTWTEFLRRKLVVLFRFK